MQEQYSDFAKSCILDCHKLISSYLDGFVVDNDSISEVETRYWKMRFKVEAMRIAIPADIYKKMEAFMDEEIEPLIDWNGNWLLNQSKDSRVHTVKNRKMCGASEDKFSFCCSVMEIKCKLEHFAMKELYPVMVEHCEKAV